MNNIELLLLVELWGLVSLTVLFIFLQLADRPLTDLHKNHWEVMIILSVFPPLIIVIAVVIGIVFLMEQVERLREFLNIKQLLLKERSLKNDKVKTTD